MYNIKILQLYEIFWILNYKSEYWNFPKTVKFKINFLEYFQIKTDSRGFQSMSVFIEKFTKRSIYRHRTVQTKQQPKTNVQTGWGSLNNPGTFLKDPDGLQDPASPSRLLQDCSLNFQQVALQAELMWRNQKCFVLKWTSASFWWMKQKNILNQSRERLRFKKNVFQANNLLIIK